MGKLFDKAIKFAVKAHKGQKRKGTEIPYIVHPMEAAAVAATMTDDDRILAAAVLHDVVEDTEYGLEDVIKEFGLEVAELVSAESENKREEKPAEETWKIRKEETIRKLKNAPISVKIVALGDKLSNIRAISRDYDLIGDELWQRFNKKDKKEQGWYYRSIAGCFSELSKYAAYKEYIEKIEKIFS